MAENINDENFVTIRLGSARKRVFTAICYGLICHALFGGAVIVMAYSLHRGLNFTVLPELSELPIASKLIWNLLLIIQFPLFHSFLLTPPGKRILSALAPSSFQSDLQTTLYVAISAAQILLLFIFWAPSGVELYNPEGWVRVVLTVFYALSWVGLAKAMWDADIRVQTGTLGWIALLRGEKPRFRTFSTEGMYRVCRHPIYLTFLLIIWSAPTWTLDRAILTPIWTAYLLTAPRRKERRYLRFYGERYQAYLNQTPYLFPRLFHRRGVAFDEK